MTGDLTYFSWLRRGLSASIESAANDYGVPTSSSATVSVDLGFTGIDSINRELTLAGPDTVAALAPNQILRRFPEPAAADATPGFFPLIEFADPAMPWFLTPSAPSPDGRLIPWLALVALPTEAGAEIATKPGQRLQTLSIPTGAGDWLPRTDDLYAWAHVEDGPAGKIARVMAPLRLLPNTAYTVALVPVFEGARRSGLDLPEAAEAGAALAWSTETQALQLPVYDHWSFVTGRADFETLVRRLQPVEAGPKIGYQNLDISTPGGGLDAADLDIRFRPGRPIVVSVGGALKSPVARQRPWPSTHRKAFKHKLRPLLAPASQDDKAEFERFDRFTDDPVVGVPRYGSWQLHGTEQGQAPLPEKGWEVAANLDPRNRAAAGLGSRAVRRFQEEIMSQAWAVASGQAEIAPYLRQARTALTVSGLLHKRLIALDDETLALLTHPVQHVIQVDATGPMRTVADHLGRSNALPDQVLASGFRRATVRAETALRRAAPAMAGAQPLSVLAVTNCLQGASLEVGTLLLGRGDGMVDNLVVETGGRVLGHRTPAYRLDSILDLSAPVIRQRRVTSRRRAVQSYGIIRDPVPYTPPRTQPVLADMPLVREALIEGLNPDTVLTTQVFGRVDGLTQAKGEVPLPARVDAVFEFQTSAVNYLTRMSPEFLLPGYGDLPDDSVSLMSINRTFIESYLLGLNHETSRELAWRGFPAELNNSWFRRFWDYSTSDPTRLDIKPIHRWHVNSGIGKHDPTPVNERAETVVLVKSPIFKRYPDTLVYLVPAEWVPGPPPGVADTFRHGPAAEHRAPVLDNPALREYPTFSGQVGHQGRFFGFKEDAANLRGNRSSADGEAGFFVVFEQAVGQATFGLDAPGNEPWPSGAPELINDLNWAHLAADADELAGLMRVPLSPDWIDTPIEGLNWAADGASMARLTRQAPVRIAIHADAIIADGPLT